VIADRLIKGSGKHPYPYNLPVIIQSGPQKAEATIGERGEVHTSVTQVQLQIFIARAHAKLNGVMREAPRVVGKAESQWHVKAVDRDVQVDKESVGKRAAIT